MPMPKKTAPTPPRPTPTPSGPSGPRHSAASGGKNIGGHLIRLIVGGILTLIATLVAAAVGGSDWSTATAVVGAFLSLMIAQRNVPGISWKLLSFTCCHPAGFFLAASFMASTVAWPFTKLFGMIPGHDAEGVGPVVILLGYAFMAIDGLRRGPDTYAVWAGVILPCLSGTISGSFGRWLLHYGNTLRDWITSHTAPTIGTMSMFALGLLFFVPMLYFRHCYHEKVRPGNGYARWVFRKVRNWARA